MNRRDRWVRVWAARWVALPAGCPHRRTRQGHLAGYACVSSLAGPRSGLPTQAYLAGTPGGVRLCEQPGRATQRAAHTGVPGRDTFMIFDALEMRPCDINIQPTHWRERASTAAHHVHFAPIFKFTQLLLNWLKCF